MNYKKKYLKYKLKYLTAKKLYGGMKYQPAPPDTPRKRHQLRNYESLYERKIKKLTKMGWSEAFAKILINNYPDENYPVRKKHYPEQPYEWSFEIIDNFNKLKQQIAPYKDDNDIIETIQNGLIHNYTALGKILQKIKDDIEKDNTKKYHVSDFIEGKKLGEID